MHSLGLVTLWLLHNRVTSCKLLLNLFLLDNAHFLGCLRKTNARINHIHERTLRSVYNDVISPFEKLLGKDKSETIDEKNIKILSAELFKTKNNLLNDILTQLICKRNYVGYNLLSQTDFSLPLGKSVNYSLTHCDVLVQKYWILFLAILKILKHLENSQRKLSYVESIPQNCPCRIYEYYIYQLGFANNHKS